MPNNKKNYIIQNILLSFLVILFTGFLIGVLTIKEYPNKDELKYKNYTFVNYEYVKRTGRYGSREKYYIYVKEYEKPLEIDNIVVKKTNLDVLKTIQPDDIIVVSIREYDDNLDIYSFEYNGDYVLTYEDYLSRHNSNNKTGIIVTSILSGVTLSLLIFGIIYYKKTGKLILFW